MRAIDYFDKGVDAGPDKTAIADADASYSYLQVRQYSEKIARAMCAAGLQGEQPAGIYSDNHARLLFCMLGIMRAGAVWVPINSRNASDANAEYMNYVGMAWLFYHSHFRDSVRELRARVPSLRHLVCLDADDEPYPSLDHFMNSADASSGLEWGDAYGNLDRLVGLVPTGGTTGPAKGVKVTSLAWGTMTEMAMRYWRCDDTSPVCLTAAPLSHAAGVVAFVMFALGGANVIMPKFDAEEFLRNIEYFRVTHLFLPPTALYNLLAHPNVGKYDYSSLRVFLLAGSPVSPDKLKRAVEIFGPCICQCYGQTEAPMLLTWLDQQTVAAAAVGDHPERLRSCGKPTSAVRLAVMDNDGKILAANQSGEIVARGALVCGGYYRMPEATDEIRAHGWHHTGDIGYLDDDGYLYIVDRKKDMIITGGFNVYCAEVEAAIMAFPEVEECAVIGVPDDIWGEAVKAIVVVASGRRLAEDTVVQHCKRALGSVKAPKSVEFWPELPKTGAAKINRRAIRERYWQGVDRHVH